MEQGVGQVRDVGNKMQIGEGGVEESSRQEKDEMSNV